MPAQDATHTNVFFIQPESAGLLVANVGNTFGTDGKNADQNLEP